MDIIDPSRQAFFEGKELYGTDYPQVAEDIAHDAATKPRYHPSFEKNHLKVFRGDTEQVFEEMLEDGDLVRDFPIYFADRESTAKSYVDVKQDDSPGLIVHMEVPYEEIEIFSGSTSDVELRDPDLEPGKLFYIGTNMGMNSDAPDLEFVASKVPEEWYSVERL